MKKIVFILTTSILLISCKNTGNEAGVTENSKQATIDSMNVVIEQQQMELAKQKSIDSMQTIMANQRPQKVVVTNAAPAAPVTAAQKKKGWSGAAKGAVIGAGVGAVTGAVINKKDRGTGAIIGGLAGAGIGAGTGAILDAEKKKKAEREAAEAAAQK